MQISLLNKTQMVHREDCILNKIAVLNQKIYNNIINLLKDQYDKLYQRSNFPDYQNNLVKNFMDKIK